MTVTGPTGGSGTRATARRWPVTEGLTAGTTKQEGKNRLLTPKNRTLTEPGEGTGMG